MEPKELEMCDRRAHASSLYAMEQLASHTGKRFELVGV